MNWKKVLALVLSLTIVLSLAACGSDPAANNSTDPSGSPSGSSNETPSTAPVPAPAYVKEYTQKLAGVDPDTVMFTVDGTDATAEFFFYWLAYDCYTLDMQSQMYLGLGLDFDEQTPDGITYAEYMKNDAREFATAYLMLEKKAEEMGLGITEEQQTMLDEQKAAFIEQQTQEGYEKLLRQQGMSEAMYDRLAAMSVYMNNVLASIPEPTEEEAETYCKENEIYGAKHILLLSAKENEDGTVVLASSGEAATNEDGTPFTGTAEEYNTAAKARIDEMLAEIDAADDPIAKFNELMNTCSQDGGLVSNPDGYTFTPDTNFVPEFKDGVYALEIGEHSGMVESSHGYHILLRTRPDVTSDYVADKMSAMMQEWTEAEYTTTPAFDALDTKSFYENYTEYAQSFIETPDMPSESPSEAPSESDDPAEAPSESGDPAEAPSESGDPAEAPSESGEPSESPAG